MALRVGVLLNRRILQKAVRGVRTFERIEYYVEAARELDVELVLFDTAGAQLNKGVVTGYVPGARGKLRHRTVELPGAVHKRALYRGAVGRRAVARLQRRVYLFNPEIPWDKYAVDQLLRSEPRLCPNLPEARPLEPASYAWFQRQMDADREVFVKPRRGSLGLGILKVAPLPGGRCRLQSRSRRWSVSMGEAWRRLIRTCKHHYLQAGIPLCQDEGCRVDLRVVVQRGGDGRWHVPGMAAKRAPRRGFLTNVARGASVHVPEELLGRIFGPREAARILEECAQLGLRAAETLAARHPRFADLGIDVGVDQEGKPFLIEVNRRDLRIMMGLSGQHSVHRLVYKNPIAYARHVLLEGA